ncbi:MAG: hypothetical protein KDD02_06120 [Phaeodactylibacter sp.]|nr:hypothetical protein [Phaeodactylibacter sp.]MCB9299201.1 hypothetical protein [Lewinellaceae bacterium]
MNPLTNRILAVTLFFCLSPLAFQAQTGSDAKELLPGQEAVYTGIYLMNLYDLNINEHSFYADFYIWFKWKGERNPMNIEFVNAVEKWGFTQNDFHEEALELPDGFYYNGMRIEGRFYHPFSLYNFPLDRHQLTIHIENVDYPQDSLIYLPDSSAAFIREDFRMPGWNIKGGTLEAQSSMYKTNFGETGKTAAAFSNFTFKLKIARPLSYFLLKLMLPLLIVIIASLGALFIHPSQLDARISLPIGGLLSAVFLQQSYSSALPDVGYMVLMDKIYLVSFGLIVSIMLRAILVGNKIALQKKKDVDILNLKKADRRMVWWGISLFLALVLGLLLTHGLIRGKM